MGFQGFSRDLPGFLAGLAAENSRDWFEAHRADYEALWLKPGLDLIPELSGPFAGLGLMAVPKLNASLRRINRDTRFSSDKRPYHARLHLLFSTGPAFNRVPGVHVVISDRGFGHGVGHFAFSAPGLVALRAAFCDGRQRAEFLAHLARVEATGARLGDPELAKVPKGLPAGEDWDHLLRRKQIVVRTPDHRDFPDWLFTADCAPRMMDLLRDLAPLARWLVPFAR